jgi:hypothetical protein
MSKSHIGHIGFWSGKKLSTEHKNKISNKISKSQQGKNNSRAKKLKLISPEKIEYIVHGELIKFCKEHNISAGNIYNIASKGGGIVSTPSQQALALCKDANKRINTTGWIVEEIL